MSNLEYLVEPDVAIKNYYECRNYMYLVLVLNLVFEIMMTLYIVNNEMEILNQLNRIYKF